ncbi:MAG: DUF2461 domain-containing protein [Bacteroidales bacterium]
MNNIMSFLSMLQENNNREWFAEHKEEYEIAKSEFEKSVNTIIGGLSQFDSSLNGLDAKDCIWRIYRDVRFSYDKSPYKTHFGAFMAKGGRKSSYSGYYLHMEPGNCLLGGGIWCPDSKLLSALRRSVYDHTEEFLSILNDPGFKSIYDGLDKEDMLKIIPRNFPKDYAYPDLIKVKSYLVSHSLKDSFSDGLGWENKIVDDFKVLAPLHKYLNYAVDEFYDRD